MGVYHACMVEARQYRRGSDDLFFYLAFRYSLYSIDSACMKPNSPFETLDRTVKISIDTLHTVKIAGVPYIILFLS